jgi:hypothetical protein
MALGTFLFVPYVQPFRFSTFFWTYVVPVIPFVMWFDGVVSCLRAYTPEELREIAAATSSGDYTWSAGTVTAGIGLLRMPVTYLIGLPAKTRNPREEQSGQSCHLAEAARAGSDRIASTATASSWSVL